MTKDETETPEPALMVSSAELAEAVGIDLKTIDNWLRRGIISRSPIGGRHLRNRLFSKDEVSKTALIAELARLGIQPSHASEAVTTLWDESVGLELPRDRKVYAVLVPTEGGWSVVLCWQKRSGGALIQVGQSGGEKTFDLPKGAFAVVPISAVLAGVTERLGRLIGEEQGNAASGAGPGKAQ